MASGAQFEAMLKEIIADEREQAVSDLTAGGPEDYPSYREVVGFIRALDLFGPWCAEIARKLEER